MKIKGKTISGPSEQLVVIPRDDGNIVIRSRAVLDFEPFMKINPQPEPPKKMFPGGVETSNVEDPDYLKKIAVWASSKTDWMFIKSLEATPDLTWDTVDKSDPKTWSNYRVELESVFTPGEVGKILEVVMTACGLNQDKIDEATKLFLAGQEAGQEG
jgi:hypothetical protein